MIEFVGVVPYLRRITLRVATWKPCVLNLAQTDFFRTNLSRIYGVLINNLAPIRNCPGCNVT